MTCKVRIKRRRTNLKWTLKAKPNQCDHISSIFSLPHPWNGVLGHPTNMYPSSPASAVAGVPLPPPPLSCSLASMLPRKDRVSRRRGLHRDLGGEIRPSTSGNLKSEVIRNRIEVSRPLNCYERERRPLKATATIQTWLVIAVAQFEEKDAGVHFSFLKSSYLG